VGWLIAIPFGYLLDRVLVWLVRKVANVVIPLTYPLWYLVPALAGTILLALLMTLLPIRRAARHRPGDALRYAEERAHETGPIPARWLWSA
jgi:ABC-type lipoprotein release transport system permease subunit